MYTQLCCQAHLICGSLGMHATSCNGVLLLLCRQASAHRANMDVHLCCCTAGLVGSNRHVRGPQSASFCCAGKPLFVSLLLYLNASWPRDWAAETLFLDADTDVGLVVRPKPYRAVLMDQVGCLLSWRSRRPLSSVYVRCYSSASIPVHARL